MELVMNDDGVLVGEDGNPFLVGNEPVKVKGAQTANQVNSVVEERLAREREKTKEKIASLETQANRTPALEKMLEEQRAELARIDSEHKAASERAAQETAAQHDRLAKENQTLKQSLSDEQKARMTEQVTNLILSKAGDTFISPSMDIAPKLLTVHKREPVLSDGKPVPGQFIDLFKIDYKNEKDEDISEYVPVEKALELLATKPEFQHYVKATGNSGSGGGRHTNFNNLKRSAMSPEQKSAFIDANGSEAFQKLPA